MREQERTHVCPSVQQTGHFVRAGSRRMLYVRVRIRLFARGERWLGHGQGDALFPWEKERRPLDAKAGGLSRVTRPTNRAYVCAQRRSPDIVRACVCTCLAISRSNSLRTQLEHEEQTSVRSGC